MLKTYLVTGAAGFIGSAIAKKLILQGNKVITIDNLSTGNIDNVPENCIYIKGDVYDENIIKQLENYKFDAIIHIAGQSSGEISFENPVYDLKTNTQSTLMLLDYAKKNNVNKFIYASSMSVYGDLKEEFVNEKMELHPKSFYAVGKLASENYMKIYSSFGIECTALRFFNVYGIGQNMDNLKQGMASIYLAMALKDKKIVVKGSKDRFRDFVCIDDVVDSVLCCLESKKQKGFDVYNVSTGVKHTVEQVINEIQKNLSYKVDVEYVAGTPGDQHGIYGDNTKLKQDYGWQPKTSFDLGIAQMVEWAKNK